MADAVRSRPKAPDPLAPAFLSAVLNRMTDGIALLDRDGRCRYLNEPAGVILGRTSAELVGGEIWSDLPENLRARLREECAAAAATGRETRLVDRHAKLAA